MNCTAVEDLLALYAAGECDHGVKKDIRAHLLECTPCQQKLDEVRQVVGLLDLHHRAEAGLARLKQSLQREVQRRPAVIHRWPHVQRLAAVAALLLVVLGLGLWLPVLSPSTAPAPRLELALALRQAAPTRKGNHQQMKVAPVEAGSLKPSPERVIDLEGRTVAALRLALQQKKDGILPAPPRISLELVLRNPGPRPLVVQLDQADVTLDLRGPEVRREKVFSIPRLKKDVRTIPPGGQRALVVDRLVSRSRGEEVYLYPTEPGDYTLTAQVRVPVWPEGRPHDARTLTLKAGPMTLRLGPGR
jgi:hypothetical protein